MGGPPIIGLFIYGVKEGAVTGVKTLLVGLNEPLLAAKFGVKLGAFVLGLNSVTLALIGGAPSGFFCMPRLL